MTKIIFFIVLGFIFLESCAAHFPKKSFSEETPPPAPDYSKSEHWAALPSKRDLSDSVPSPSLKSTPESQEVDVFFLHPTSYTGKDEQGEMHWNAAINDAKINETTDLGAILNQASIFNEVGRVYAPRYRQAHLQSYFVKKNPENGKQALDLAYQDVKAAFEYYLKNYNQGRPIIIASHSQGTTHAGRLMREFFDGKVLQNKLVVAYLIGMPVTKNYFKNIFPCENQNQTGCFCSWRTWQRGYYPAGHDLLTKEQHDNIVVTNPLDWKTDGSYASSELNTGAVLRKFNKIYPKLVDAQASEGVLWIKKPRFAGSFLIRLRNYHVGDFNLFWMNVRQDAKRRVGLFWK